METLFGLALLAAIFLRPAIKNIFKYYFSFSGFGYFILHSKVSKRTKRKTKQQSFFNFPKVNPATGYPMTVGANDVRGNIFGTRSNSH